MPNLQDTEPVYLYTDGACSGNPGPGGWGAILEYKGVRRELSGGEPSTTNNRMELRAVIEALSALKEPCEVELWTDSQYIARAINEGWLAGWKRRGWRRKEGELKNPELWQRLDALLGEHRVTVNWLRGHDGQEQNERCDALAVAERDKFSRQ